MSNATFWALIGSLITALVALFAAYIAQRIGLLHFGVAQKQYDLNLLKSAPIIDSTVRITEKPVDGRAYHPWHFVVASIYNHGDLAAKQLKGHWRMYSPDKIIEERTIPVVRDAPGSSPYEFEPIRITGENVDRAMAGDGRFTMNVDIELDYFGISKDQPQHYSARYQYDAKSRDMVRI